MNQCSVHVFIRTSFKADVDFFLRQWSYTHAHYRPLVHPPANINKLMVGEHTDTQHTFSHISQQIWINEKEHFTCSTYTHNIQWQQQLIFERERKRVSEYVWFSYLLPALTHSQETCYAWVVCMQECVRWDTTTLEIPRARMSAESNIKIYFYRVS